MVEYNPSEPLFSLHIPKTAGTSFENILRNWFNEQYFPNLNNHPRLYRWLTPSNADFWLQRVMGCGLYLHYSNEQLRAKPRPVPLGYNYGILRRRKKRECVHGHFDPNRDGGDLFQFYPQASQFITFLRDPLEMQLSLFFYLKKMVESGNMYWGGKKVTRMEYDGDIDRWVEERGCYMLGFMPMKFNLENYKQLIDTHFVHIGVTENMQRSIDLLAKKLSFRTIKVSFENATPRHTYPSDSSIKKFKARHELEYQIYNYAVALNN